MPTYLPPSTTSYQKKVFVRKQENIKQGNATNIRWCLQAALPVGSLSSLSCAFSWTGSTNRLYSCSPVMTNGNKFLGIGKKIVLPIFFLLSMISKLYIEGLWNLKSSRNPTACAFTESTGKNCLLDNGCSLLSGSDPFG